MAPPKGKVGIIAITRPNGTERKSLEESCISLQGTPEVVKGNDGIKGFALTLTCLPPHAAEGTL